MLRTDNMFTPYRLDITDSVQKENTLSIVFESALRRGKEIEEKEGVFTSIIGDSSRRYVRKAQYHYGIPPQVSSFLYARKLMLGWDWGPTLMTCGPWKEVRVEIYESRIEDVFVQSTLNDELTLSDIVVEVTVENPSAAEELTLILLDPNGKQISQTKVQLTGKSTQTKTNFNVQSPQLWWPVTHGSQPLYSIVASIVLPTPHYSTNSSPPKPSPAASASARPT